MKPGMIQQLQDLTKEITTLSNDNTALSSQVTTLEAQIADLTTKLTAANMQIAADLIKIDQLEHPTPVPIPDPAPLPSPVPEPIPTPDPVPTVPAIPQLAKWEADTKAFADIHAKAFFDTSLTGEQRLGLYYYDAARVYHRLAAYFTNPAYLDVRNEAITIYRDEYLMVQPKPGAADGKDIFPDGLYLHYMDTNDDRSKQALLLLSQNAAYAQQGEPIRTWLQPLSKSREAAYNLRADLYAEKLGSTDTDIEALKDICVGHLTKWRAILDGTNATPYSINDDWLEDCRPFMVGLTCEALIEYQTRTPDAAINLAVVDILNEMWAAMYLSDSKSMKYTDRVIAGVGGPDPSPDVNMLIAPAYMWIGQRERADLLFEGSVEGAYITGDKQFNQANRWTIDGYFAWRNG